MDALLLPIGHDLGALYAEGGAARRQQVRAGAELAELTETEFAVWMLAHGIDDRDRPTRSSLLAGAERFGLDPGEVTAVLDQLLADRLLVAIDPQDGAAIQFAKDHQLVPLLTGLGPDPDQPWMHTIGVLGQPIVQVSAAVHDVWLWSHLAPQLWAGCEDAAEVARAAGLTAAEETEPQQVLRGLLSSVHGLLCVRAAYLDRRTI